MFTKLAVIVTLFSAVIGIQALPQSGEHSCAVECLAAASAYGQPPLGCNADDNTCLGCGQPGFVKAMEECLQQSCHETVMLTCGIDAVRRQLPTISIPDGVPSISVPFVGGLSSGVPTVSIPGVSIPAITSLPTTGITASGIGLGPSGLMLGSTTVPLSSIIHQTSSTQANSAQSTHGAPAPAASSSASSSGSNGGSGSGSSSAAMGISAPFNAVVGAGVAAIAVLSGSGLVL